MRRLFFSCVVPGFPHCFCDLIHDGICSAAVQDGLKGLLLLRHGFVVPFEFSQMQDQMIRMEICGKIDAGLQIFHKSFPGVSRPGKTGGIAMMLIGLHSPRFQFPADPPGFRVEIEAARFFEVIAGNHDFGHSGFAHAVDVVTDFRIGFFDELFSIPDDAFHAV